MELARYGRSALRALGRAADGVGEIWSVVRNGTSAVADWVLEINRRNILRFARKRFPREFAALDGGDRRIMTSFLDPGVVSNTVSLLGSDLRLSVGIPLKLLGVPGALLGPFAPAPDSEFDLSLSEMGALASDMFGTHAGDEMPTVIEQEGARQGEERWFFLNGIATSRGVARRNAAMLQKLFGRSFITIHNPTQGLSQDLVESAMEKFTNVNTEPVAAAFVEIAQALADPGVKRVAVVAHSQGTIIAGDVLDLVYYALDPAGKSYLDRTNMNSEDLAVFLAQSYGTIKSDDLARAVASVQRSAKGVPGKLELYMFANAASRMCYLDPVRRLPHIESFANEHDLVARLGCLAEDRFHEEDLIRIDGPVFLGPDRYGHLLNAHYLAAAERRGFQVLAEGAAGSPRRSLHDPVTSSPCARNPRHVPGDPRATSRLLDLLGPAPRRAAGARRMNAATSVTASAATPARARKAPRRRPRGKAARSVRRPRGR